jgi:uncharacterized membrane protein YgaE (UPF0421/DUF939 family)
MQTTQTEFEGERTRPPILKRVFAALVLIVAAVIALKLIIGFVMAIFWLVVVVAVAIAVLWALKTLVW